MYLGADLYVCLYAVHVYIYIGADFHPQGTQLATASGDGTIKVWDFATATCKATFSDHTQVSTYVAS